MRVGNDVSVDRKHGWSVTLDCSNCDETYWVAEDGEYICELCGATLVIRKNDETSVTSKLTQSSMFATMPP